MNYSVLVFKFFLLISTPTVRCCASFYLDVKPCHTTISSSNRFKGYEPLTSFAELKHNYFIFHYNQPAYLLNNDLYIYCIE